MFFDPKIFSGWAPEILDQHYKTRPSADYRAKFRAGWPTRLRKITFTDIQK